ncbi:MAG: hypothetical protein Q7T73_17410 [Beijerinckiaceae bacterium]|nr:hypothetical protein [Beijerinckiaceae bacterium]
MTASAAWGCDVSLQIAIMKVLAGYPDGRASVAGINRDLAILAGAGAEWSQRLRRIANRAPSLDIFSEGYVIRDDFGWGLTDAGRGMLSTLEASARASTLELSSVDGPPTTPLPVLPPVPKLVGIRDGALRRRRPVAYERSA